MEDQNDIEGTLKMEESTLKIEDGSIYCPWCGKRIPLDTLYCEYCGKFVPDEEEPDEEEPDEEEPDEEELDEEEPDEEVPEQIGAADILKKLRTIAPARKKYFIFGALAVLFILLIMLTVSGSRYAEAENAKEGIFYIKDNSLYGIDVDGYHAGQSGKEESVEYSSSYLTKWGERSNGAILKGGNDQGERSGGTVPAYSKSGQYLFYLEQGGKDGFDLSRTKLKNQETKTLDSGVYEFITVGTEEVVYKKENQALFYYDGARKYRLTQNASYYRVGQGGYSLLWTTEEEGTKDIYYQDLSDGSEKIRLGRNADLLSASPNLDVIFVLKENTVYRLDLKWNSIALAEEVGSVVWADVFTDAFYFIRDVEAAIAAPYKELYYYSQGETVLLDDSLDEILWQQDGVVLYRRSGDSRDFLVAAEGKTVELGREVVLPEQTKLVGAQLYFLSPDEMGRNGIPEYELCYVNISGIDPGRVETVDRGVSELAGVFGKKPYYFKNTSEGIGDLYCDGELRAYDVASGSVEGIPGSSSVLCIADSSSSKKRGTLTMLGADAGKDIGDKNIGDKVYGYSAISEQEILVLSEYNREKGRGDLLLYDGQNLVTIQNDIWGYYGVGSSGFFR